MKLKDQILKIKDKCPLALNLFFDAEWISSDRDLYDFFDDQGIIGNALYVKSQWNYLIIYKEDESFLNSDLWYLTRQEAEEALWIKCFEILEDKLKVKI